ncbi:MAG TPA: TonB C-terminal domain-containing protein [Vicinamibacterales bacterium]|nr:TonB C-terminal domain-containing protein [Vicinamibacterales bacterium]
MREAVSDILVERAQISGGMSRMVALSLAAHVALVVSLLVAPDFWSGGAVKRETPMTIMLGGAEGPDSGGMNTIAARPVQRVAEPDAKPERPAPPAAKPPEMVAPTPAAKPAPKTPDRPIEKPRDTSSSRKPTSGAEIKSGSARAETGGAQIPFGGLTTGGGGTGGARVDVANFCCPSYLASVVSQIKRNWNERQGISGQNTIKFVIQRDGRITDVAVDQSGGQLLDIASQRALVLTKEVSPLPREFTGNTLTVYLIFEYSR